MTVSALYQHPAALQDDQRTSTPWYVHKYDKMRNCKKYYYRLSSSTWARSSGRKRFQSFLSVIERHLLPTSHIVKAIENIETSLPDESAVIDFLWLWSKLKNCWKSTRHVPKCLIAGDANAFLKAIWIFETEATQKRRRSKIASKSCIFDGYKI